MGIARKKKIGKRQRIDNHLVSGLDKATMTTQDAVYIDFETEGKQRYVGSDFTLYGSA